MSNNFLIVMCENEVSNYDYFKTFTKIGVERGCLDLINHNQEIDLAISDFDNVIDEELGLIKEKSKKLEILDSKKDLLDGEIAIKRALADGAKNIVVITKPTKRYDMNLSVL
ncbi:hypothetical protein Zmor_012123 [Zophobas morio]|uniref:Uncharacterized protein n=1 Tax=Zophobas morio TaxID=2755281 RepID=A0AA38LZH3_9CUCU|nr:hypothetical protein Zmor_012123 [Zophobas morio]